MEGQVDVTFSATRPGKDELCHNGIDDDLNGLTDCADPACFNDQACPPPVCAPDVDFGTLTVNGPNQTTTLDLRNGVPHETVTCAKGGGRSRVVQFKFDQFAGLNMDCNFNGGGHPVIDLFAEADPRASCDQHELACGDPVVIPFGCGWEWPALQPGTYYVIVQAFQAGDEGLVTLSLSAQQNRVLEICNNGIDDDMDGFTDCLDTKCALSPVCLKLACKADQTIDPMPVGGMNVIESLDTRNHVANVLPACAALPNGGDQVILINLPKDATVALDYSQPFGTGDHVVALYPDKDKGLPCDASPALSCQPTNGAMSGNLSFGKLTAGKYWVVVAANKPGAEGPIDLSFSAK